MMEKYGRVRPYWHWVLPLPPVAAEVAVRLVAGMFQEVMIPVMAQVAGPERCPA
ncbi:hypothetical protein Q668_06320 [Alcanivorax sp. PN-3]|nr:hypothetical protein Q668_06320 [Alcanivorax sp. PN-3]